MIFCVLSTALPVQVFGLHLCYVLLGRDHCRAMQVMALGAPQIATAAVLSVKDYVQCCASNSIGEYDVFAINDRIKFWAAAGQFYLVPDDDDGTKPGKRVRNKNQHFFWPQISPSTVCHFQMLGRAAAEGLGARQAQGRQPPEPAARHRSRTRVPTGGRAASGGALAPGPLHATRLQPEPEALGRAAAELGARGGGVSQTSPRAHWIGPES